MTGTIVVEAASTGGGSETTPAPTDAVADDAGDGAWFGITLARALRGIVMLVGTVVADWRFRAHG